MSEFGSVFWDLPGYGFVPPRIVFISSSVPDSLGLCDKMRNSSVIPIHYNYETADLNELYHEMISKLSAYRDGCCARSVLLYCRSGVDCCYFTRSHPLTLQRVKKNPELIKFLYDLGNCITKITPSDACLHVLGGNVTHTTQGQVHPKILIQNPYPFFKL